MTSIRVFGTFLAISSVGFLRFAKYSFEKLSTNSFIDSMPDIVQKSTYSIPVHLQLYWRTEKIVKRLKCELLSNLVCLRLFEWSIPCCSYRLVQEMKTIMQNRGRDSN